MTKNTINAGVVLVTKFVGAKSQKFTNYINYIDREKAVRNKNTESYAINELRDEIAKYNRYMDYMDNPLKTSELFTAEKDKLNGEEKAALKAAFETAQKNNSLMWQTVISFDNRWLAKNGLYDAGTKILDENKLKECTRGCMDKMLTAEEIKDSAIWSAAIHYNTDNIHIHVATVEPRPTREVIENGRYVGQVRGKFKQSSITAGKQFVVNNILQQQKENQMINNIIRKDIIESHKNNPLINDKELCAMFLNIYRQLPDDKRVWNYRSRPVKDFIPLIDDLSNAYLQKYQAEKFDELKKAIKIQSEKYREAYGVNSSDDYYNGKINDLYYRLGNSIFRELREYDKSLKEERKNRYRYAQGQLTTDRIPATAGVSVAGANPYLLEQTMHRLKKALKSDYEHSHNLYIYEQMQREAEREF